MSLHIVNSWNVDISMRETVRNRATADVRLHLPAPKDLDGYQLEMTPDFARTLARRLKKYADFADPPKRSRL